MGHSSAVGASQLWLHVPCFLLAEPGDYMHFRAHPTWVISLFSSRLPFIEVTVRHTLNNHLILLQVSVVICL